jgi:hypothetical protein
MARRAVALSRLAQRALSTIQQLTAASYQLVFKTLNEVGKKQ